MRAAIFILLTTALLFAPRAARAVDPPPLPPAPLTASPPPPIALRLTYRRSPGAQRCPSEQVFRDEVAAKMGYDPFTTDAAESVVITLTRSAHGSTSTVEFNEAGRARGWDDKVIPISDDDCEALVMGSAFYLALEFLDIAPPPSATAPSAPPPPAEASPPPPVAPAPPPPTAPSSPSHRSWRGEVGISPFVAFGIAPGVAFGGALSVGLHWPSSLIPVSLSVEAHVDGSAPSAPDGFPGAGMKTLQVGGAFVPCWRPRFFLVCGVVTGSEVYASSAEIGDPKAGHSPSLRAGGRVGAGVRITDKLDLRGYGGVLGTLVPIRVGTGAKELWRTQPVSGDVGVALLGLF